MKGIIGKKIGMTSVFDPTGKQTACTIIEAGPCVITQVRTKDNDGYDALQLAFGDKNEKHSNQSEKNHFAKASTSRKICKNSVIFQSKILVTLLQLTFSRKASRLT
jgi:large subunit ribosomal protein L3